jgi:hypothetical protein
MQRFVRIFLIALVLSASPLPSSRVIAPAHAVVAPLPPPQRRGDPDLPEWGSHDHRLQTQGAAAVPGRAAWWTAFVSFVRGGAFRI